jgi:hypothetical protein
MPENKPLADLSKSLAESPICDVFEGRHPAASEKEWAEKTLAPTLEKAPEKPIGAPLLPFLTPRKRPITAGGFVDKGTVVFRRRHQGCRLSATGAT